MSYPWKNLSPKDGYSVKQSALLSDIDQRVLTSLYYPIIGASAYSLFMVLKEEVQTEKTQTSEKMFSDLLTLLDTGISEFYQARIRLEAVGLLRTYRSKQEKQQYLYELIPPLSPHGFFADDVFSLLLMERVGEKHFKLLHGKFIPSFSEKENYQEVTRSFLEVFQFNPTMEQQNRLTEYTKSSAGSAHFDVPLKQNWGLKNSSFDWDFFYSGLNKHFVKREAIDEKAKQVILMVHEMYGIDELQMQRYVMEASDVETGTPDLEKMKNTIHRSFHNEQAQSVAMEDKVQTFMEEERQKVLSRETQLKQAGFSSSDIAVIESSEENRPMTFLQSIKEQKGGFVTRPEQWTLEDIVSKSKLPSSVINILIHYILVIKNSPVFDRNLAYKIANDWAQQQISSPEAAMKKVKELKQTSKTRYNESKNTTYNNKKQYSKQKQTYRRETLPDWARTDQSGKKEQRLTDQEQQVFKERLKKIRSYRKEGDQ